MFLPIIICKILSRSKLPQHNTILNQSEYSNPVNDTLTPPDCTLNHRTDTSGEKIYFCKSIRELFPRQTKPTDKNLFLIGHLLRLQKDLTPQYIWLCIMIHEDQLSKNEEVMIILRNDPNAVHTEEI